MESKKIWCLKKGVITVVFFLSCFPSFAQNCGDSQQLNLQQKQEISSILIYLDSALQHEDLFKIDSLNVELKNSYGLEGGKMDAPETYSTLSLESKWLDLESTIELSRKFISKDSLVYVNLWKAAKGMSPPLYQPNSLFLRASAEIASGLLKIANKESDLTRKELYNSWAIQALDSLATMQLPNGAFPFPDTRMYGDQTFKVIIQNFLNSCGADSVNVLKNGFIVDDKGTGEFKFDAGIIANAYFEAYNYTNKANYKTIVIQLGDYLKTLKYNVNYNYNSFVSLGLVRAFQLTNDSTYLVRAMENLRFGVFPGQIDNGRWVDGHNANSRYHSVIIQNCIPFISVVSNDLKYGSEIRTMMQKALTNLMKYTYSCGASTGYRWLLKTPAIYSNLVFTSSQQDSMNTLIGKYVNQSQANGNFLDVPTLGEYLELLQKVGGLSEFSTPTHLTGVVFPNPIIDKGYIKLNNFKLINYNIKVVDLNGGIVREFQHYFDSSMTDKPVTEIDLSNCLSGIYFVKVETDSGVFFERVVKR